MIPWGGANFDIRAFNKNITKTYIYINIYFYIIVNVQNKN
jgi:hypothetical protein